MLHHPVDVFQHVAAADLEQFMLPFGRAVLAHTPGVQRLGPGLHGGVLVVAQGFELVQCQSRLQQRVPTVKARVWVEQFGLPVVQLAAQFAAQVQVTVDHVADDAQHHVGRAGGYAPCACRAQIGCFGGLRRGVCAGQQAAGVGFPHGAVGGVNAQQNPVKHGKADRARVDAVQHGWARAFALSAHARCIGAALSQPPEHHQVVVRTVVKTRGQLGVQQVRHMQVHQAAPGELFECVLNRCQLGLKPLA